MARALRQPSRPVSGTWHSILPDSMNSSECGRMIAERSRNEAVVRHRLETYADFRRSRGPGDFVATVPLAGARGSERVFRATKSMKIKPPPNEEPPDKTG